MTLSDFFVRVIDVFGKKTFTEMFCSTRKQKVVYARWIVAYYLRENLSYKQWQIGNYLNKKRASINQYLTNFSYCYRYKENFRNLADKVLKE